MASPDSSRKHENNGENMSEQQRARINELEFDLAHMIGVVDQQQQRIAELEQQVKELEENLDIEREELCSLESDITCYEEDEIKLNEKIKQLREALRLAKDMMQANDLYLPKTLDVIDNALEETK